MREYVELVQFYNQKATKYEEIAKLQETNMKVSESDSRRLKRDVRCWNSNTVSSSSCSSRGRATCR